MTSLDLNTLTGRLEKLPRAEKQSVHSHTSGSPGKQGEYEPTTMRASFRGQSSPHPGRKSVGEGDTGATAPPSVDGDLEIFDASASVVKTVNQKDWGITADEGSLETFSTCTSAGDTSKRESMYTATGEEAESDSVGTEEAQRKTTAVEDSGASKALQDLVERNWEADHVATRGPYDTRRLSYVTRMCNFVFTFGGQTLPLKRTIMNAILFGVVLRLLRNILIAIGVQNGWLCPTIQNAPISKESTLEMRRALESHFRKPRTGQFDRRTFCQIVRVVTWVLEEIRDDLHALRLSSHARDDHRGHLYRVHFARDWSLHFPPMLKAYCIVLDGTTKPNVIVKDPLRALSDAQLRARSLFPEASRRKGQKTGGNVMGEGGADSGLATALASFWFAGLHVHTNLRTAREKHTVLHGQPIPYTVKKLRKLPKIQRLRLKERCLDVNQALVGNIELVQAEIRASLSQDENCESKKEDGQMVIPSHQAHQSLPQLHEGPKERVDQKGRQAALTHLQSIQQGLQQDLHDIKNLFLDDQITDWDVDILLFYNGLRTHSWTDRWYGIQGDVIVEELGQRPDAVMRQAFNVGRPPRKQ